MRNTLYFTVLILISLSCSQEKKMTYEEEIQNFHYKLNVSFSDKKTSPLKEGDFNNFKKLHFFDTNKKYKIVADFKRTPDEAIFEMQTNTERKPLYTQYGIATFIIDGKELSLRIYQEQELMLNPEYEDYLFIPFNDLTNGNETYDAGRYIDLEIPDGKTIVIDFNKAYNPYCAYNSKYSCPIPPKENDLNIEIKAGVLAFKNH